MNVNRLGFPRPGLVSVAALIALSALAPACSDKSLGDARPGLTGVGGDGGMSTGDATNTDTGTTTDVAPAADTSMTADVAPTADTGTTLACNQSSTGMVGGQPTGFATCDGILHRQQKLTCPNLLPRAQMPHKPAAGVTENCKSDADCTAMPRGYCEYSSLFLGSFWSCQYGCLSDQDCGAGFVCNCGDPVGICQATTCTTDADCAPGKLCAAGSGDWSAVGGTCAQRFACQTAADQCQRRTDCKQGGANPEYCAVTSSGRKCLIAPQDSDCF